MRHFHDSIVRAVSLLLLAALSPPAVAAPGRWEPIGPYAADVQALAVAPSSPTRVYLATHLDGVYRSDDRGDRWVRRSEGLPDDPRILCLSVDPSDADVVLAGFGGGVGVYRTDDGGRSWTPSGAGIQAATIQGLAHLGDTGIVLAGVAGIPGTEKGFGIYRSADGGRTWRLVTLRRWGVDPDAPGPRPGPIAFPNVLRFAVHPTNPRIVLANGRDSIFRSDDGGLSWTDRVMGFGWGDIAFSPADPGIVFACRPDLMVSHDGGLTFAPVSTPGLPGLVPAASALALDPGDPDRLLFAWGFDDFSYELPFFTTRVYSTTDQGSTWSNVFASQQGNQRPTTLAYDPSDPTVSYLGMSGQNGYGGGGRLGLYRSEAGGASQSWTPRMHGIGNSAQSMIEADSRGALFTGRASLLTSTDAGRSWSPLPSHGLVSSAVSGQLVAVGKTSDLLWYVGSWFSWDLGGPFAYRSTDCGQTWSPDDYPTAGLPRIGTGFRAVTVDHGTGSTVYVWEDTYVSGSAPLYRSDDGGDTFQSVTTVAGFRDAVVDPTSDLRLVVAAETVPVVRVSEDGGVTWSPLDSGLPAGKAIRILMDPDDPGRMTVVFEGTAPHRSTDGGQTWAALSVDLFGDTVVDADWNSATGEVFLATGTIGVLSSVSGLLNDRLGTRAVRGIRYSAADHSLLAATANGGIRRLVLPRGKIAEEPPPAPPRAKASPLAMRVLPNPAEDGPIRVDLTAAPEARVDVAVFDVAGRRVRTLAPDRARGIAVWDGRDDSGRRAAAGVYLIRMSAGEETVTRRVTIVR